MKNHLLWAVQTLEILDYCLISSDPEKIQDMPWSKVYRFETSQGNVYLKKTPPSLSIESNVIKLLAEKFHAYVPIIIAENQKENCFLMKDAGISLRSYFKQYGFDYAIFIKALNDYVELQYNTIDFTQDFLKLGVSDWSVDRIPKLYETVVYQEDFLSKTGLTFDEIKECQQLIPIFHDICQQLLRYKIPNTFNHCDFHDNNILIDPVTHKTTLADLSEVEITHPFFSLSNAFHQINAHFQLTAQQCEILLQEAFKPWLKLESASNLQVIMKLIQKCYFMHHILSIHRIMEAGDPIAFKTLVAEGRLTRKCRHFLDQALA